MAQFRMPYQPDISESEMLSAIKSVPYDVLAPNYFRLVQLEDIDSRGILRCSLTAHSLEDWAFPSYIAMSYTWDASEPVWYGLYDIISEKPVLVNGKLTMVPNKLANILSLMYQHGRRSLWIDSISINQHSIDEKSTQVSQMGKIYLKAVEVVSLIGSPSVRTDETLTPEHYFSKPYFKEHGDRLTMGMIDIFAFNDYWRRAWVLQEITLARKSVLCCGTRLIDFDTVKEFWATLRAQSNFTDLTSPLKIAESLKHFTKMAVSVMREEGLSFEVFDLGTIEKFRESTFLNLLRITKRFDRCQDPRDLIYSRLALATDAAVLVASPDYSLTVTEVYTRFAVNCVTKTNSLEILTHANVWHTLEGIASASWVPDWTAQDASSYREIWRPVNMRQVNIAAMAAITWEIASPPEVRWDQGILELAVSLRVLHVVPSKKQASIPRAVWKVVTGHAKEGLHELSDYDNPEALVTGDMVCILPSCSHFICLRPKDDYYTMVARLPFWQKRIIRTVLADQVWSYEVEEPGQRKKAKWRFRDPEAISGIETKRVKIR